MGLSETDNGKLLRVAVMLFSASLYWWNRHFDTIWTSSGNVIRPPK